MANLFPRSEVTIGKKLTAASIATTKGAQMRPTVVELPRQNSSKRARTSSGSTVSDAASRPKLSISQRSDGLALEVLSMYTLEV